MFANFLSESDHSNDASKQVEEGGEVEENIHEVHLANLRRSLSVDSKIGEGLIPPPQDRIVNTVWFQVAVNAMTLLNTIQMGFEADYPQLTSIWMVFENVFTAGFLLEMIIKLVILRVRYFKDPANWLDGTLSLLGVLDCWILSALGGGGGDLQSLSILRILRLMRLARILKLVRSFKPFVLVIRGVIRAVTTSAYILVMLMVILYVFGIFFTEHLGHGDKELYPGFSTEEDVIAEQEIFANYNPHLLFGSMFLSMMTLFNMAIMAEWSEVIRPISLKQPQYVFVFILFAGLVAFGVMNVMIGMIVDSVVDESKRIDADIEAKIKNEKLKTVERIQGTLSDCDTSHDDHIDLSEFKVALEGNPDFSDLLNQINVPAGWSPDEFMAMLDNSGNYKLDKREFTTALFRLLDCDEFQQICIMQASVNQTKYLVKQVIESNEAVKDKLSTLDNDIKILKTAMQPAEECQKEQTIEKKICQDVVEEACGDLWKQQRDIEYREHERETARPSTAVLAGCSASMCSELKEKVETLSHKQLTETLDAAYTVMKESFQKELATMQPNLEKKLIASAPECKELLSPESAGVKPSLESKLRVPSAEKLSTAYIERAIPVDEVIQVKDCHEHLNAAGNKLSMDGDDANDCRKISAGGHVFSLVKSLEATAAARAPTVFTGVDDLGERSCPDSSDEYQSAGGSIGKSGGFLSPMAASDPEIGMQQNDEFATSTPAAGMHQSETTRSIESVIARIEQHQLSELTRIPDAKSESAVSELYAKTSAQTMSTDLPPVSNDSQHGASSPENGMHQSETSASIDSAVANVQQSRLSEGEQASCKEVTNLPEPTDCASSASHLHSGSAEQTTSAELPSNPRDQHASVAADLQFTFEEDVAQLGFEVYWVADQLPVIGRVWPGGAADARGVHSGDNLVACNDMSVQGRTRQEVLQVLRHRPLQLRMQRVAQ